MKTLAAVLVECGKPLELRELELPKLLPGQLVVDVAFSGVCHTQLSEARGRRGEDKFLPHALGHEGSGVVSAVGPDVTKVKVGQRVVLTWLKGSGKTVPGTKYGEINSGALCTFMTRTVTCESRVVPIPDAMPLAQAALLGCAVPTGAGVVFNTMKPAPGSSVAVFGAGGLGLNAVMAAAHHQARVVAAVDVVASKLDLARKLGATHVVDASREDPVAAIRALTGGAGADFSVETAGKIKTMEQAFESVRAGGGLCVLAGNLRFGERISIDPFELIKGKRLVGSWGGETDPDRDIPRYAKLYLERKLKLDELITRRYPLDQVNEALADLEAGKVARALIAMEGA